MDAKDVQKIIKLMEEHGLSEIEIEDSNGKIRLKKGNGTETIKEITGIPVTNNPETAASPLQSSKNTNSDSIPPAASGTVHICSPLVGTFYRKPDPDSDPFVDIGDHVDEDTIICMVEAMKVMNEIKAEQSGMITNILVEDAHPVEYMQPIFEIEVDG
ncbi:acetyl-CoA carboxylase biotin carboxyl carrier protein [Planctomycetota bacterium]